jgi:ubiquinone/menaquinone biosynthesis C-methylase UbiE
MNKSSRSEKTISGTWDKLWKDEPVLDWERDSISQSTYKAIKEEICNSDNLTILEAGCGTGRITIRLAKKNSRVVLLDSSVAALMHAQKFTPKDNKNITFVNNSIYNICFRDSSFDVVWNAGVLEHFYEDEQKTIINEMLRVCKNGGRVFILVPYKKAILYRIGKWLREKMNLWKFGREVPLSTLEHLKPDNGELLREYVIGISEQTFLLPKGFKKITKAFIDILIWFGLGDFLKKTIGGFWLVSVFEKKGNIHY